MFRDGVEQSRALALYEGKAHPLTPSHTWDGVLLSGEIRGHP